MTKRFDHTTGKTDWETPPEVFDLLNKEFRFTLDPCATPRTAKCRRFFTSKQDGLTRPWCGRVFVNPPYGRQISSWVRKGFQESLSSTEIVVMLLPARTDPDWWHDYVMKAKEVRLTAGRLCFLDQGQPVKNPAFGSAIVVFDGRRHRRPKFSSLWIDRREANHQREGGDV